MTTLEIERQELKEAALNGDVDFLKKCVASNKPTQFYSTFFPIEEDRYGKYHHGNIFHIATIENREEFIREIIQILPVEETQRLFIQPNDEELKWNPLHIAAMIGNVEIVKMILDVYTSSIPSLHSQRPWLLKNFEGNNPLQVAHMRCHEECALQLLKMDQEMFCNMIHEACGASIIYEAIYNRMSKLALEILRSPHSIGCAGRAGRTPLHVICHLECSDETKEIFRRLLLREPGLIIQKSGEEGLTIFHCWANTVKTCLFKYLLDNDDILPDVKRVFVDLIDQTSCDGENPLHCLARNSSSQKDAIEISELLIDIYKKEASTRSSEHQLPWLVHSKDIETPLSLAIDWGHEMFAMHILSVDENAVITCQKNVLFLAIQNRCHQVAKKLLEIVYKNGWTQLLTDDNHINVLHLAPLCTKDLCTQLIENHPELLKGVGKGGMTVLHTWIITGVKVWLIELICKSKCRHTFAKLIEAEDYTFQNNPFHYAAITTTHEETSQVVKLLVTLYKEENTNRCNHIDSLPWFVKNKEGHGPLHLAILKQRQELALYILSLHPENHVNKLLDYYKPEHAILFLAIRNNCHQVAQHILKRLDKKSSSKYLRCPTHGDNILHLATNLTDEEFGTLLVSAAPEFIIEQDYKEQSPWDKAYEVGSAWFIKAVLKEDPSVFNSAPLSWIKACKKGHVSALRAFIDHNPGAFRDLCIKHKDSPLHHIKLQSLTDYEEFLKIPRMKDLINLQDSKGATPLHKAIRNEDLLLTETLLNMDKVIYDINDDENESAIDLLAQKCNESEDKQTWDRMCKRMGVDPIINTTYFKSTKTNLFEVRNSLFVVAALLATITFTAGFTLPGGFNQETGEALLSKKAAFLVFLVSDTSAFFFSMMVLICLIWSMVYDSSKSLVLIDRSMVLLRVALNCTILAFMTGTYIVIAQKSLWAAILIIGIMCTLIGISVNKNLLYKVIDKSIPTPNKKRIKKDCQNHDPEMGNYNELDRSNEVTRSSSRLRRT